MPPLTGVRKVVYQAYRGLPGPVRSLPETLLRVRAEAQVRRQPWFDPEPPDRWLLGPLNTAGQADAWARAARQHAQAQAVSLSVERIAAGASTFGYATDVHLTRTAQLRGMASHRARVLGRRGPGATGVVAESGRPVLGDFFDRTILEDLPELDAAGIRTVLLVHGSEMRDLRQHAERDPHSPFRGPWDERCHRLQALVDRTRPVVEAFPGPVLVSTLDMLEDVPGSRLLPVTTDVERFTTDAPALRREVPVVLHAPTNPRLKGTDVVEPVLSRLHDERRIVYRRLTGVPHAQMPELVAAADVVVDQIALGNVGALAAESMAAGRLVVGHVTDAVRARARLLSAGGRDLPVVEADPASFEDVLRDVVSRPEAYHDVAAAGPAWAREHHDGRRAAQVLSEVLGTTGDAAPASPA